MRADSQNYNAKRICQKKSKKPPAPIIIFEFSSIYFYWFLSLTVYNEGIKNIYFSQIGFLVKNNIGWFTKCGCDET